MTKQNRLPWCDAVRLLAFFMLLCCHAADPFYASVAYASKAHQPPRSCCDGQYAGGRWYARVFPCS